MTSKQWRKHYMVLKKITVNLVHRNLIAAYPDKEVWEMKILALKIVEDEVKKKIGNKK